MKRTNTKYQHILSYLWFGTEDESEVGPKWKRGGGTVKAGVSYLSQSLDHFGSPGPPLLM